MKYKKAKDILPEYIIEIIQEYVNGEYLYIPIKDNTRKSWGEQSGLRKELSERNKAIFNKYKQGATIEELVNEYYLTESSIRRIVRQQKIINRNKLFYQE